MQNDEAVLAHRGYARVYRVSRKRDIYDFLADAVSSTGAEILFSSPSSRAPVYFGLKLPNDERLGVLVYPFRMTRVVTEGRPKDEVRGQFRYGSEHTWRDAHPLGQDLAGVDVTLVLGIHLESETLVALDPQLHELLPMGNSFYMRDRHVEATARTGWHVWESSSLPSKKRSPGDQEPNSADRPREYETLIALKPEQLIRLVRFERQSRTLRLDPALRYKAALRVASSADGDSGRIGHALEDEFALNSRDIIEIISQRNRLAVAVRGGVAEFHLEALLRKHPSISNVVSLDKDGMHDFDVKLHNGDLLRIECKNASPEPVKKSGEFKVEVQKTRASQGDPASRFYKSDAFDVVAACMFSPTGEWAFRFARTESLPRHQKYPDRLAAVQHIGAAWVDDLGQLPTSEGSR